LFEEVVMSEESSSIVQKKDEVQELGSKLLGLEYEHATQNLFKVEDLRNRLFEFYALVTGIVVTVSQIPRINAQVVAGLSLLVFVFGIIVVAALARLRMLTIASYRAQTLIRQYYIKHHSEPFRQDLKNALLWDEPSVPQKENVLSYSFLSSFSVMFLNSVVLGVAIYESLHLPLVTISVPLLACVIQVRIYLTVLNHEMKKSAKTERFWDKIGHLKS
jgi:hypothetical protein